MRMPFGRLMDLLDAADIPPEMTIVEIAVILGEPAERICDAFDAVKERNDLCPYLPRLTRGEARQRWQEAVERRNGRISSTPARAAAGMSLPDAAAATDALYAALRASEEILREDRK